VGRFTEFVDAYDAEFNYVGQESIVREDTDLPFSPNIIAGSELTWSLLRQAEKHQLEASLLSKYVGQQYLDLSSDDNNVLDPYFFSDVRLRYVWQTDFVKEIELTLLLRNIFDAQFATNAWSYRYVFDGQVALDQGFYPQAGRNVLLGLMVRF